ncbi:cytochrome c biogenesis CcdA family protein [Lysobacter silvisoli]|uniref:Cytochrome c biogenesis protein CcdA n=1 Tax=Lysobacter silvisoli TaxID=2293254 RepID=A0A371K044_9GAMM|nr:cytochrome c biogenesis CcdA family protein [Lysobacter silvisoli]RDZ27291.1 cytochrome c biogenesis protein CcdA [Lysobacter silvisoli]
MIEFALALAAGMATILSPCILPVLPIVLATSAGRGRVQPLLVVTGFTASFAASGLLIGALAASSGQLQGNVRTASIVVLLLAGLACLWPAPFEWALARMRALLPLRSPVAPPRPPIAGKLGALLVGASLGLAWTPCAGPVLASVLSLAASAQAPGQASALLGVYALGAGLPMLLIAYGGHWVSARLAFLQRHATAFRRLFGAIAIGVAVLQLLQYDALVSAWATQWLPPLSQGL